MGKTFYGGPPKPPKEIKKVVEKPVEVKTIKPVTKTVEKKPEAEENK